MGDGICSLKIMKDGYIEITVETAQIRKSRTEHRLVQCRHGVSFRYKERGLILSQFKKYWPVGIDDSQARDANNPRVRSAPLLPPHLILRNDLPYRQSDASCPVHERHVAKSTQFVEFRGEKIDPRKRTMRLVYTRKGPRKKDGKEGKARATEDTKAERKEWGGGGRKVGG